MEAAVAIYSNRYRSHWGAELALQGARLRFSWAYLAAKAPTCQAGMTFGTSSIGFDPAEKRTICNGSGTHPWRPAEGPG